MILVRAEAVRSIKTAVADDRIFPIVSNHIEKL